MAGKHYTGIRLEYIPEGLQDGLGLNLSSDEMKLICKTMDIYLESQKHKKTWAVNGDEYENIRKTITETEDLNNKLIKFWQLAINR